MENEIIQKVTITTDCVIEIHVKNSTVDTSYGMPVCTFVRIMDKAFTVPSIAPVPLENEGDTI
jgi:hypothetical protein